MSEESIESAGISGREPAGVRRVAVVGTGLVGARWAALFLAAGLRVTAADPAAGAEARMRADVAAAWPALVRLGRVRTAEPPQAAFTPDLEDAVAEADWVQESVDDDVALKTEVIRRIDAVSAPHVPIASSTSGLMPSVLQSRCAHPERVLVGHPFNPVHILPLVEVVAGAQTTEAVVERAVAFYTSLGKKPLRVRKEAPGFVADRIQEAVYREMFHLVEDGIATTAELDAAVTDGPGLRWALFGPAFVYMLQGGRGGTAHALAHFDPSQIADWSHNTYPAITPELVQALDEQTGDQARGRALGEWEALRDDFLIRVLQLRESLTAAGGQAERPAAGAPPRSEGPLGDPG